MIFGQIFGFLDFLEKCQKVWFFVFFCAKVCFFVSQVFSGFGGNFQDLRGPGEVSKPRKGIDGRRQKRPREDFGGPWGVRKVQNRSEKGVFFCAPKNAQKCAKVCFLVIFWGRKKVQKRVVFSAEGSWRRFKKWSRRAKKTSKSWFRISRTGCCASGCKKSSQSYKMRFFSTWEGNSRNRQNRVLDWKMLKFQLPSNKGSIDLREKTFTSWQKSPKSCKTVKKQDFFEDTIFSHHEIF